MTENEWIPIIVTLVAFVIGYGVVNWIILLLKTKPAAGEKTSSSTSTETPPSPPPQQETREEQARKEQERQDRARKEQERQWKEEQERRRASASSQTYAEEAKYGAVLGLKGKVAPADVKRAYRELLLKYHPDKVSHLGIEFQKIAEEKTKNIIVAYEYFKKRYNLNE